MQSPDEHLTPKALGVKSRRWVMTALLVAAIVVGFALLRPGRPAPFVVLRGPFGLPASFRDWVDRCIPSKVSWRWAWNVEQRLFGARKPVLIQANIVSFADSPPTLLTNSTLGPPNFSDTNGLCIWLLSSNQVGALRGYFKQTPGAEMLSRPRISTAEGIEATMALGQTVPGNPSQWAGITFGCTARFRRNSSDFLTRISASELVTKDNDAIETNHYAPPTITMLQTNLDTALRLQLPKGNGVFFLDESGHQAPRKNIGVLIDPL